MIQMTNEYESYDTMDGHFGAMNLGGFSAAIYATYKYNGQMFSFDSGMFTLFLYREIKIPAGATDVHLYALIGNGLGQWTPVYNNNFLTTPVVELKLGGTIWAPYATILADPNRSTTKVLATNTGAFVARYKIGYNVNGYSYDMESQNFSVGMSREIAIPNPATNISIVAEYFNGIYWINLYNNNISTPKNVTLTFSGTTAFPSYQEKITPPDSSQNETVKKEAKLMCAKKPHTNMSDLNHTITFAIHVANATSTPAHDVMLHENLSRELELVPHSFKINGVTLEHIDLSSPVRLGDIQMHSSLLITYKAKVISIPGTNQIIDEPMLNFNYLDENNVLKTSSSKGVVITLNVGQNPNNNCCPCCCCSNCQCQ